jgi:DNA-binding NtrC family response regulator
MLLLDRNNALNDGLDAGMAGGMRFEIAFARRQRKSGVALQVPSGLVVSSDNEVRRKLAEVLRQCALTPVLASTVAESAATLAGHEVLIVVCNELLDDGKYEDVVQLAIRSKMQVPVIVVSRTGDWPEYLAAMGGGVFDYLAFPPIPGDLQQTIRNALLRRQPHLEGNGEQTWASTQ